MLGYRRQRRTGLARPTFYVSLAHARIVTFPAFYQVVLPAQAATLGLTIHQANARKFTLSASLECGILCGVFGPAAALAHVFPEHQAAGQAALETPAGALALYSALFAPP